MITAELLQLLESETLLFHSPVHGLKRSCSGHTHVARTECATLDSCWDADRLDLGRVGIIPSSQYLFTARAKEIADTNDYGVLGHG